jgi:5-formyltetrahydrofolate cyclo-ligase
VKNKKELRQEMARQKAGLTPDERLHLSAPLLAALESHPAFGAASTVLLYHSLPDEVDTHAFVRKWWRAKRLLLPVVVGADLELREYKGEESMALGRFGIEEPVGKAFTDYGGIDLAVVPGVAFDRRGNRLGRGRGYYDRLLPSLPSTYKIGICFPFQLVEEVPAEPFDIRMDEVLTFPVSGR